MGLLYLMGESGLNPRELFANGEQGLWLDPSDMNAGKAAWRRNLLTYSEQFDNSVWAKLNATATANATPAPDGTSTAEKIFENSTGNVERVVYPPSPPTVTVATYTFSVYAKASENIWIYVRCDNGTSSGAWFNLQTGAVGTVEAGISAAITNAGNGWYRCSVTKTLSAGTGYGAFQLANADNVKSYVGVVNNGIFVWGAQLELGSTPTEYQTITDFSTEFKAAFPTHTLYQDSNGVTPCTAAGDPVGLILDQSRGGLGALGSELVTNGGFDSDTWWTKDAGIAITGGQAVFTSVAGGNGIYRSGFTVAGKWYRVTFTIASISAGGVRAYVTDTSFGPHVTSPGTYQHFILANSSNNICGIFAVGTTSCTIDNISVREVPGNHAYQTTSASRPTLARIPSSGRRNLLTRTEEFDNAAWTKYQSTISPNATTAPDGTSTADSFVDNAVTQEHTCYQSQTTTTATFSVYAKANARSTVGLRAYSNLNEFYTAIFDLQNGVVSLDNETGTTFSTTTSSITSVGSGWYRCSISYTRSSGTTFHVIDLCNSTNPTLGTGGSQVYLGNGTGIFIWGAQLETGSTATNYQKVVATTDVTESGVGDLWHLVFDGSDDSLVTNSVDFSGTAQMTVIAGVRKLSDAANACIAELSATISSNAGSFAFFTGTPIAAGGELHFAPRGTAAASSAQAGVSAAFTSPVSLVATAFSDISNDSSAMRINGAASGTIGTGDQGSGNFGNYQLFIGRRNQASFPYNGHLYQLIIRGKTTPTGKLLEAERFAGKKTGVSF